LSEWFPLCCFDKLMQEAAKENIRLTVEKDEIELADEKDGTTRTSRKEKPAAYLDNPILFRRKGDGSWYIIKGAQDAPMNKNNADFKAALKSVGIENAPEGNGLHKITFTNDKPSVCKITLPVKLDMDNTGKITGESIDEFRFLSAWGDEFLDISMADFRSKVKKVFDEGFQKDHPSPKSMPYLTISQEKIAIKLDNGEKWCVQDCHNDTSSPVTEPQSVHKLATPDTQDQVLPPDPEETGMVALLTYAEPYDSGVPDTDLEGTCGSDENSSLQLLYDSYKINLKSKEESENIGTNFTPKAQGIIDEVNLKKMFDKPTGFSELIETFERVFPPARKGQYADTLAAFALLKQVSVEFAKAEDNPSLWQLRILSKPDKEINEATKKKLEDREKALKTSLQTLEEKARKLESTRRSYNEARKLLEIENIEDISLGKKIKELQNGLRQTQAKLNLLSSHSEQIDPDPEKLKTKIGILTSFITRATDGSKSLRDLSGESLEKLLTNFAEAYRSLSSLYQLKDFQNDILPEFTRSFGDIGDSVMEAVSRLESSFKSINSSFVIHDAIRAKLSNPDLRKKALTSQEILNKELERFNLKIIVPRPGEQLDPTHHKVVGYESGGSRGTISALVSWGLVGLRDDKTEGTIIFKPEIKIYQ